MGGTVGGSLGAAAKNIRRQKYAADERARQYKVDKIDTYSEDLQSKGGELSGGAYRTTTQSINKLQKFGKEIGEFMRPSGPGDTTNDTTKSNYSSSGQKSGSGKRKKGKLESKTSKTNLSKRKLTTNTKTTKGPK